jgi:hypothetical protein
VSDKTLERIEKSLQKLARQAQEIGERLTRLEERLPAAGAGPQRDEVIRYLDRFRAGEALGEASLGAWIAVCGTECLRGGLRTVQRREGSHARLLEERIKELGGAPSFELPERVQTAVMEGSASAEKSDAAKVKDFVARFPDVDAAVRPIHEFADRLDADPETQSLLRTIAQDERATLEFLHDACRLLNPS